jgi:hypothetical protein
VLAAVESRTLFPCENWVNSWKNIPFKSQISRLRKAHFVQNSLVQLRWRNKCISRKNTTYGRSRSIKHILSLWELCYFLLENFPQLRFFKLELESVCSP